jgi:hypothetical protein
LAKCSYVGNLFGWICFADLATWWSTSPKIIFGGNTLNYDGFDGFPFELADQHFEMLLTKQTQPSRWRCTFVLEKWWNEILCFQVNLMNIGNLLDLLTFTNEGIKLKFRGFQRILFSLNELYNFVKVFRVSILIWNSWFGWSSGELAVNWVNPQRK